MITPDALHQILPNSSLAKKTVARARHDLQKILQGQDHRLAVIVGPCSLHDLQAAEEYAEKLSQKIIQYQDSLCIIMRTYFEKARTTTGWKGWINDPDLNNTFEIEKGLQSARAFLLHVNEMGLPAGMEIVNPASSYYFSDLLSWSVIGARTAESQTHRELASSLNMPVGFKNNTSGDIQAAIDGIQTAREPHHFLHMNNQGQIDIAKSSGNPFCHLILRGSQQHSNYDAETITRAVNALQSMRCIPRILIDCSHGNSQKNHAQQMPVLMSVAKRIEQGDPDIFGVMLESYLLAGKQTWIPNHPLQYGQSITDACLSFEDTEIALEQLHQAVQNRVINSKERLYVNAHESL